MKTTFLWIALAVGTTLPTFAQKKDDVYPAVLPEQTAHFKSAPTKPTNESIGFKIVNYAMIWQKVFNATASKESIEHYFKHSGMFKKLTGNGSGWSGFLSAFNAKGAEISGILSPYTRNTLFSAFVILDFKDNRYRVTVKKIMIMNSYENNNVKFSYDDLAFKSNQYELKPSFLRNEGKIMDEVLTRMFTVDAAENEDNW